MSFESDDVDASRLVRKNLYRPDVSPAQRESLTAAARSSRTSANQLASRRLLRHGRCYDYDNAAIDTIPAYCVIREWHKRERAGAERSRRSGDRLRQPAHDAPAMPDRPPGLRRLRRRRRRCTSRGDAAVAATVTSRAPTAASTSRPAGSAGSPDIQAARPSRGTERRSPSRLAPPRTTRSRSTPMNADGTGCALQPDNDIQPPRPGGLLEHDFDPVFSPPARTAPSASSSPRRAATSTRPAFDYSGPAAHSRGPHEAQREPLRRSSPTRTTPARTRNRQLTWQLNMERLPELHAGRPGHLHGGEARAELLPARPPATEPRRRRLSPALRAARDHRLPPGHLRHRARGQGLRHHLQRPGRCTRGGASASSTARSASTSRARTPRDYLVDPSVIIPGSPTAPEPDFFLHSLKSPTSCVAHLGQRRRPLHEPRDAAGRPDARQLRRRRCRTTSPATTTST